MGKRPTRPFEADEKIVYSGPGVPQGDITLPLPEAGEDGESHHCLMGFNGQVVVPASLVEQFETLQPIIDGLALGTITKIEPAKPEKEKAAHTGGNSTPARQQTGGTQPTGGTGETKP